MSHWRRHPANLATLLIGLAIATALWSGVQALNEQARRSYDRAAAVFGTGSTRSVVSTRGGLFSQDLYVKLRMAGWKVSPVLEGTVRIGDNSLRLIGVEPLTLPHETQLARIWDVRGIDSFLKSPWQTIVSPETLRDLGEAEGATPVTDGGQTLPPIKALTDVPAGLLIVDIGIAQVLLERPGRLSRLIMNERMGAAAPPLAMVTGDELRLVEPEEEPDLARLTDSFHLNLTAFGLLAFLVGLFIVHASFGLAFEQRLPMIRTIRAVGVSARTLIEAMLCELLMLALIAGGAGMMCGYLIAAALLPDVAASLNGLYGAQVAGQLALDAKWVDTGARHGGAWGAGRGCGRLVQDVSSACSFGCAAFRMAPGATEIYAASGRFWRFGICGCSRCTSLRQKPICGVYLDRRSAARGRAPPAARARRCVMAG